MLHYYGATCGRCGKLVKLRASDDADAWQMLEHMNVCPASVHPASPSLAAFCSGLRKISRFEYFHADL